MAIFMWCFPVAKFFFFCDSRVQNFFDKRGVRLTLIFELWHHLDCFVTLNESAAIGPWYRMPGMHLVKCSYT